MGVMRHTDGAIHPPEHEGPDGRENAGTEQRKLFSETLETYIGQLEGFAARSETTCWELAVVRLRDAARVACADRIEATASDLLSADISDGGMMRELLDRLRSDGRIYSLEEVCRLREEALAAELSAFKPVSGRD